MIEAKNLLAHITALEAETKAIALGDGGASRESVRDLFVRTECFCELGLEHYPEQTYEFARRRAHAHAGAEMMDRHIREAKQEAAGVVVADEPESEIAALWERVTFLRSIVKDLDAALDKRPNDSKLDEQMSVVVGAMVTTIAQIKELEKIQ